MPNFPLNIFSTQAAVLTRLYHVCGHEPWEWETSGSGGSSVGRGSLKFWRCAGTSTRARAPSFECKMCAVQCVWSASERSAGIHTEAAAAAEVAAGRFAAAPLSLPLFIVPPIPLAHRLPPLPSFCMCAMTCHKLKLLLVPVHLPHLTPRRCTCMHGDRGHSVRVWHMYPQLRHCTALFSEIEEVWETSASGPPYKGGHAS